MSGIADALRQPGSDDTGAGAMSSCDQAGTARMTPTKSPLDDLAPAVRRQISGVVERVFLPNSGDSPRLVAFAAVDTHACSGWITAAVADMLAYRTRANVAVVDMNVANPALHEYFGLSAASAHVDVPDSETPLLTTVRQVRTNLWVIPGVSVGVSGFTAGLRAHIAKLANAYDHVIVSVEPLTTCCGTLPTMVDGIVLVIAADGTRRQAGRQVAERLQASGVPVLGAVLTNRRYAIPEAIYKRL